jgi:hypothetical protein
MSVDYLVFDRGLQ